MKTYLLISGRLLAWMPQKIDYGHSSAFFERKMYVFKSFPRWTGTWLFPCLLCLVFIVDLHCLYCHAKCPLKCWVPSFFAQYNIHELLLRSLLISDYILPQLKYRSVTRIFRFWDRDHPNEVALSNSPSGLVFVACILIFLLIIVTLLERTGCEPVELCRIIRSQICHRSYFAFITLQVSSREIFWFECYFQYHDMYC